jgi:hypothetical protein
LGKHLDWTEVEDRALQQLARSGMLVDEIAARMGCSAPAIRIRSAKLGIAIAKGLPGCSSKNVAIIRRKSGAC